MCAACNYHLCMAKMIQIRNVPEPLHRKLKARAALEGKSLSDYLLSQIRETAQRPTMQEIRTRLESRQPVILEPSPADILREERDGR